MTTSFCYHYVIMNII